MLRSLRSSASGEEAGCGPHEHGTDRLVQSLAGEAELERASRLFRALGDTARLRLAERLAGGEFCVTELAEVERESVSTISQRLRVLRAENIVTRRRNGKHINYALADQHVTDLINNAVVHAREAGFDGSNKFVQSRKKNHEEREKQNDLG